MKRRQFLVASGAGLAAVGAGVAGLGLRLHSAPRQYPFLTDAHLATLVAPDLARPRVLFIGNSMVLNNDLPSLVAERAQADGATISTATAAANGARLIETLRVPRILDVVRAGWDVVVVQDFTKTPLRAIDRWGSARVIRAIADAAAPAPVLLFPPWPAASENGVSADAGFLTTQPKDPDDYAARTMAHYQANGHKVAPVLQAWLTAINEGADLYAADGHHPNAQGSAFVADILWKSLKDLLEVD